jgi:DNA-binding transcriptional LysR family regulator
MREPGLPSLDQLRVFVTVIDTGGFANAARHLQRTQSVISYTIANLEEQLNVVLLDRSKRKPVLTEAGKALLADARAVSLKVEGMRARARALAGGLEAEVALAVDVLVPTAVLVDVLSAFQRAFPTVAVRLHTAAPGAVAQLVLERVCQIGVGGAMGGSAQVANAALARCDTGQVTLVAVAAPGHPLVQITGPLPASVLREHTQLSLLDGGPAAAATAAQDDGATRRDWKLGDVAALQALLHAGLGWGLMPAALVHDDIAAGRLILLTLADRERLIYPLHVIHRSDAQPGLAGLWLMNTLAAKLPGLLERAY